MMKEYNYLQAIYMSFYSRRLYRDVANNWGLGVVLYLFVLLVLCVLVLMFKYQPMILIATEKFSNTYITQMPELTIDKGQVTTPQQKPYFIGTPSGNILAIIDTSGRYTNLDKVPKSTRILLTKDSLYYDLEDAKTPPKVQKISSTLSMHFKPENVKLLLIEVASWFWLVLIPFLIFIHFVYRSVEALFYGLFTFVFAAIGRLPFSYPKAIKLAIIAMTPSIVIGTVLTFLGIEFAYLGLLFLALTLAYIVFALQANKNLNSTNNQ